MVITEYLYRRVYRRIYRKVNAFAVSLYRLFCLKFGIIIIDRYDFSKSLVLIRYYARKTEFENFTIDGVDVIPHFAKSMLIYSSFWGSAIERRIWLPLQDRADSDVLEIRIDSKDYFLTLNKRRLLKKITISGIVDGFQEKLPGDDLWLLTDRVTQADDNAEHFYFYLQRYHPEQAIVFVLARTSHDWDRLERAGFNLVDYGSVEHADVLSKCSRIVSSHVGPYTYGFDDVRAPLDTKFVFLQHGVIQNDLSGWLNRIRYISCLITSSRAEFDSLIGDMNRYRFTNKEVVLTGLPRQDSLLDLSHSIPVERMIVIMPTWRRDLVGPVLSADNRELNPYFMETEYAAAWRSLLCSDRFSAMAQRLGYEIVFFPHANTQPYLDQFALPDQVRVLTHEALSQLGVSIQDLFCRAAVLVTDYSSVAFEMAYLKKPVVYYQFDEEHFFDGGHICARGYYDYRAHGFGPVELSEENLLDEIEKVIEKDACPEEKYLDRMESFFEFRDGHNSDRVYTAVVALDDPMPDDYVDQDIVRSFEMAATKNISG